MRARAMMGLRMHEGEAMRPMRYAHGELEDDLEDRHFERIVAREMHLGREEIDEMMIDHRIMREEAR